MSTEPGKVLLRHLRPHATFGDDPSGWCGCAACDPREDCGCGSCRSIRDDDEIEIHEFGSLEPTIIRLCLHAVTHDVTISTGQVVARICAHCDAQLSVPEWEEGPR